MANYKVVRFFHGRWGGGMQLIMMPAAACMVGFIFQFSSWSSRFLLNQRRDAEEKRKYKGIFQCEMLLEKLRKKNRCVFPKRIDNLICTSSSNCLAYWLIRSGIWLMCLIAMCRPFILNFQHTITLRNSTNYRIDYSNSQSRYLLYNFLHLPISSQGI